jgi:gliding motility-associated-like protein
VTITGIPTESGTFNYTVTLTGGCGNVTAAGTIYVSAVNTITLTSGAGTDNQTICLGDPIVTITYVTTVATGANFTGLPVGMTVAWAANVVTISGTPANSGVFAYQIDLTGGCGTVSTGGTLTVLPANTTTLSSAAGTDTQNACINTPITNITYTTTGATGATFAGLPAGVTGSWAADIVTISGTPSVSGIFNYTVTLTGGCGVVVANGTITVSNDNTLTLSSGAGTDNQTICEGSPLADITYATTGATGATVSGLPSGLTGNWAADMVTIKGTPSESGTFNYIVTLTGGCGTSSAGGTINITAALPVSVSIAADANPVCAGTAVNFIASPVNQGTTPAYQWQVNGVDAGIDSIGFNYIPVNNDTITVILTSNEVCTSANPDTSASVKMTVHDLPVGSTTVTDVACFGQSSGSVDLIMTGGVLPLTFLWNNGATTEDLTAVIAGIYSVTITDGNNCTLVVSDTINEPASALSGAITSQINVSTIGGNDGSVTVDGSGGTPPYLYSLDGGIFQASGTFNSLTAGNYTVTVQDLSLCSFDVPVSITQPFIPLTGAITSQTDVLCFGNATGNVTVTGIDGVAPYEYCLNGGTYQSSGTFSTLTAGTYTVTIRDAYSNTFNVLVTITQPLAVLSVATSKDDVNCNGSSDGVAVALASGGTGIYNYSWNTTPIQIADTATGLKPGTYTVTATDANACTITADVTITEPAVLTMEASSTEAKCPDSNDGSATLEISGGTVPYSVIWLNSTETTTVRNNLLPGPYSAVVTDANGCAAAASTDVGFIGTFECVVIPDIITPDPADGYNDEWLIRNIDIYPNAEIKVYSRWGKLIYHTKNPSAEPWKGRYSNGNLVPTDSYRYILDLHDGSRVRSGVISVIR